MQFTFIVLAIGGLLYFLTKRRRFDCAALAFLSACIYFMPGFLNVVPYASRGYWQDPFNPLHPEAYLVMLIVLFAILVTAMATDLLLIPEPPGARMVGMEHLSTVTLVFGYFGFLMTLETVGWEMLSSTEKTQIMENLNRWFTLWSVAGTLAAVIAYMQRKWYHLFAAMALLILLLFVGSRAEFAVTCIAISLLYLESRGEPRLLFRHWKATIPVLLLLAFILLFKIVSVGVKYDEPDFIVQQLLNPDTYYFALVYSEPFYVQGTLNEVINQDFSVGLGHFSTLFMLAVPYAPEFGLEPVSFNEIFQPALFPQAVGYGLASNVWAEMWSSGGWLLLLAFVAIFVLAIQGGDMLLRRASAEGKAIVAVCMSYWGFYIHRNDLVYELVLLRNVVIIFVLCALIARFLSMLRPVPAPSAPPAMRETP